MKYLYWFIAIYFVSAFIIWLWYFIAYGKHGKYANQSMSNSDKDTTLATIFVPLLNTIMIIGWIESPYPAKPKQRKDPKPARTRSFTDILLRLNRQS